MRFSKPLIAAALAISMSGAPVLAQSAAPLSIAARSGAVTGDANQLDHSSYLLPAAVIIAILAAAILLGNHHNRPAGTPNSP